MRNFFIITSFLLISFSFSSCKDDIPTGQNLVKEKIQVISAIMDEWYLWPDEMKTVSEDDYTSYYNFMSSIRASKDRWSYTEDLNTLRAYLESGSSKDFGFDIWFNFYDSRQPNLNDLRVKQVYEGSELNNLGITRSWHIVSLNKVPILGSTYDDIIAEWKKDNCTFEFSNGNGQTNELNISRKQRAHNTVIYKDVKIHDNVKVAYIVFDSFLDTSEDELNAAFDYFKSQNAEKLIVDLRYNGGGAVRIANQFAGLITGNKYKGKVFSKVIHRDSKGNENRDNLFTDQPKGISFSEVVFICSVSTASSSELLINGLIPYLGDSNVILVGSRTHGKPVGMYVFSNEKLNLAILPISFSSTNADGQGEYYKGINVDYDVNDNLMFPFGDINEDCYKVAVDILVGEPVPVSMIKSGKLMQRGVPITGIKNNIGAIMTF